MKGNELINILNLEAVEHALSECIQLLIEFEFWREMSRATNNNQDMTVQLLRAAAYMQEKKKEQINVLNL